MFDYSELYFCSRNFSSYMPPPLLKTVSTLSTWSILDLCGDSYFFFLWKLHLNSLLTNSLSLLDKWQNQDWKQSPPDSQGWAFLTLGNYPGFIWPIIMFCEDLLDSDYSEYLFILSTLHYLHIFYSFNKYLMNFHETPGPVLRARNGAGDQTTSSFS